MVFNLKMLLLLHVQAVEGACCTFGQPSYEGSELVKSSFGYVFGIGTCR
jgi:hypothetical protein